MSNNLQQRWLVINHFAQGFLMSMYILARQISIPRICLAIHCKILFLSRKTTGVNFVNQKQMINFKRFIVQSLFNLGYGI